MDFTPKIIYGIKDDTLNKQLFHNRGIPPFRFPAPGKVPLVISTAEVKHQYSSSHDQLDENWVKRKTEKEKKYFKKKWRGFLGNAYLKDIEWGKKVFLKSPEINVLAQSVRKIKSKMPLVSTIVPCYNRKKILKSTIQSLIKQNYSNQQIIFVDDGSNQVLEPYIKKHLKAFEGEWKIIRINYNSGPGIARKVGMQNCNGKYIQFIDSDDEPSPIKLVHKLKFLKKQKFVNDIWNSNWWKNEEDMRILGKTNVNKKKIDPLFPYYVFWTTSSIL